MGYALEQYDGWAWLAYVLATVVFEAWVIGLWVGFGWPKAVGVSVLANFVTAGCCANLCGVGLHSTFVGTRLNPNPLANMALMFLVFGFFSGWVESIVWRLCGGKKSDNSLAIRSVAAHLAWVPLGMAIMLIPARPYPMLERYTRYARRSYVVKIRQKLQDQIGDSGHLPSFKNSFELFDAMRPLMENPTPDDWAIAYRPDFGRFATGQPKDGPMFEWNVQANRLRLDDPNRPDRIWLLRTIPFDDRGYGLILVGDDVRFAANRLAFDDMLATPARSTPARTTPPAKARFRPKG